jgi:ubiquinol-cytochrome c reductase cytochrome c subunit
VKKLLSAHLLIAMAVGCAFHGAAQEAPSAKVARASRTNGESVYQRVGCYACHGTVGHGGAGPRLSRNTATLPFAAFQTWVRNGTPGWSFASGMPAFSAAVVTDAELADVREFLAGLPAPPAAKDIPLLNQ